MEVAARPAQFGDIDTLVELSSAFRAEQRVARGGVLWDGREAPEPGQEFLETAISAADQVCVVGTIDDIVLAFSVAGLETTRHHATIGRIELLYVDPEARTVGVGEEVIGLVVQWCRDNGCVGIDAYALPGERLTKNFFESNGFVARLLTMHHRFDPAS